MRFSYAMLPDYALEESLAAIRLADELGFYAVYSADETWHKDLWLLFAAAAGLRSRLGMPAPATKRRWMWQVIEDQRALLGRAAPGAWSRGWHLSAEQVMGYAGEGA